MFLNRRRRRAARSAIDAMDRLVSRRWPRPGSDQKKPLSSKESHVRGSVSAAAN